MKILGYEDGGGCGYYRIRLPFDAMAAHGVDAHHVRGGVAGDDVDVVVGQRVGAGGQTLQWLKTWRRHAFVWETDDDLWSVDPLNRTAARFFTPDRLEETARVARIAHAVTVTTETLAERMRARLGHPNVVVLPNCIDDRVFSIDRPHHDRIVIGWQGGNSHHRDWKMVAPRLRHFFERTPRAEMHLMGADYAVGAVDRSMRVPHRHTPWSTALQTPPPGQPWPDALDYYRSIDFDIGIAPLVDNEFNRCKSAVKALEYAALGIPVVASDVEPYREFVTDGVTGFLIGPSRQHLWETRLRDLVNDEAMRQEMGAKAKEHARGWSIEARWRQWADLYEGLVA